MSHRKVHVSCESLPARIWTEEREGGLGRAGEGGREERGGVFGARGGERGREGWWRRERARTWARDERGGIKKREERVEESDSVCLKSVGLSSGRRGSEASFI